MQMHKAIWPLILFLLLPGPLAAQSRDSWIYINSFKSRKLVVFDLTTSKVIHVISVEDRSGSIGVSVTSDGKKLFIVDGDTNHRLRTFDTLTGKLLMEKSFENRALLLGGGPVVRLSGDDQWLFLKTYDYGAAASGVRIFNVETKSFAPLGLRGRGCESPDLVSARDGTLIAICPNLIHELRPVSKVQSEFLPGPMVSTPIREWAKVALSPDGKDLYILEYLEKDAPWRLVHWTKGDDAVREHDLRQLLQVPADGPELGIQAWLDISPDGKLLGIVCGPRIWILERQTMKVLYQLHLPEPVQEAAFTLDGRDLLTFGYNSEGSQAGEALLLRVSVDSGKLQKVRLNAVKVPTRLTILMVAPAP